MQLYRWHDKHDSALFDVRTLNDILGYISHFLIAVLTDLKTNMIVHYRKYVGWLHCCHHDVELWFQSFFNSLCSTDLKDDFAFMFIVAYFGISVAKYFINAFIVNGVEIYFQSFGTVSAKIAPRLKCYKNASRLNRYNFPTNNAIDFLFLTLHSEMV